MPLSLDYLPLFKWRPSLHFTTHLSHTSHLTHTSLSFFSFVLYSISFLFLSCLFGSSYSLEFPFLEFSLIYIFESYLKDVKSNTWFWKCVIIYSLFFNIHRIKTEYIYWKGNKGNCLNLKKDTISLHHREWGGFFGAIFSPYNFPLCYLFVWLAQDLCTKLFRNLTTHCMQRMSVEHVLFSAGIACLKICNIGRVALLVKWQLPCWKNHVIFVKKKKKTTSKNGNHQWQMTNFYIWRQ